MLATSGISLVGSMSLYLILSSGQKRDGCVDGGSQSSKSANLSEFRVRKRGSMAIKAARTHAKGTYAYIQPIF